MSTARPCPVCNSTAANATLFIEKNVDHAQLTNFSFAARKIPEYMSHRMVLCNVCDLVYADDPPPEHELVEAYHKASYDSSEEANDAAKAYAEAIRPMIDQTPRREPKLCKIGSGTGVFLDHLKGMGTKT